MTLSRAALALAALLLAGCASPTLKTVDYPTGIRVGVLELVGNRIAHSHVGITLFGNNVESFDSPQDLGQYAAAQTRARLERDGRFKVLDLDSTAPPAEMITEPVTDPETGYRTLSPAHAQFIRSIAQPLDLHYVVVLQEFDAIDWISASAGEIHGSGLFTRNWMIGADAMAYAQIRVFAVEVATGVMVAAGGGQGLRELDSERFYTEDFSTLSPADVEVLLAEVRAVIDDAIAGTLLTAGLTRE